MAEAVFWGALSTVVYVYVGYPAVIFVLAHLRPRPVRRAPHTPTVSFIIAAYNEEAAIAAKLENTLALDYPPDRLEVVVVSDGSADRTEEIVRTRFGDRVRLLALGGRHGKTVAQNRAVEAATGDILVFSDATTAYRRECLRALMAPFADPEVGCVGGWVIMGVEQEASIHQGRSAYADYEQWLRRYESLVHSILGASGAVYALRRRLYVPLAGDVISDMAQVVKVVEQGYRAVLAEDAVVFEPGEGRALTEELERRTRIITRGLRGQYYLRTFFNPLRHPWFCFQVLSHRLLRWAVPVFMVIAFVANLFLLDRPLYILAFVAQCAFYAAAGFGYLLEQRNVRLKALVIPLYFCVVNLAPLLAVRAILRGERKVVWETARTRG
jgi:cellulose synthase/poly-beta-1,6-N-acetylglucosamine synthase-like glycosyltransferase